MIGTKIKAVLAAVAATAALVASAPAASAQEGGPSAGGGLSTTSSATAGSRVAAAASVSYAVTNARCFSNAITFTGRVQENGVSGVQRLRQTAQTQTFNGGWFNATSKTVLNSVKFPNDSRNFAYTLNWNAPHANNGASWRVKWQGVYINGFGQVVAKTPFIYVTCL